MRAVPPTKQQLGRLWTAVCSSLTQSGCNGFNADGGTGAIRFPCVRSGVFSAAQGRLATRFMRSPIAPRTGVVVQDRSALQAPPPWPRKTGSSALSRR